MGMIIGQDTSIVNTQVDTIKVVYLAFDLNLEFNDTLKTPYCHIL
jgi:hypothetical protein